MGRGLVPDAVARSIQQIDLLRLKEQGIRALLLDLDNTLVRWNAPPDDVLRAWLNAVRELGFLAHIVSNNTPERVRTFAEDAGIPALARARKPTRSGFRRALRTLGALPSETAVVGDQIFTDIWGGNRLGCYTILVEPMSEHEFAGTKAMRLVERTWLKLLKRRGISTVFD